MIQSILKLDRKQVVDLLVQFPENEIKNIFKELMKRKLYKAPKFDEVSAEVKRIVKKEKLNSEIIEEAITWSRSQK
jgi:hypothetical protein